MKILIVLFIFSCPIFSRSLTPVELASIAEARAPLIRMSLESKRAAGSQTSQSKFLPNPILSIQSGTLKAGSDEGSVIDLTLNQPIPWPGKRSADINSAKILESISDVDLEEAKLKVHHSVSLLALELAIMKELEKHNQERKNRFSLIHRYLSSHPQASPKQRIDKDLIDTQIKIVESQMYDLETRIQSVNHQLSFLTGEKEINIALGWNVTRPPSREYFLSKIEKNASFRRSHKLSELAANKIEEARYLARPDILVGINYRRENMEPINHFYHANLAIAIPIIDRGQHSLEVARANARREEASKKLVLMEAEFSLNKSYQVLLSSYRSTELFKVKSIPAIERRFADAEQAFRRGQIDAVTFLQTDTQIHETVEMSYLSFMKYFSALSETHLLTGQKLEIK